jgi:hypothetical protein
VYDASTNLIQVAADDTFVNCQSYVQNIYPTVSFTQSIIGTWLFFGYNYKQGSSKYYMLSLFNDTPLTDKFDTTDGQNLWNTSVDHLIEFGSTAFHSLVGDYSFDDWRLYINYDSEGYDLLNTARLQMNSLCVVGCQDCLNPRVCGVCKTGYYLDSGNCKPCHYTCRTCSQATKNDCSSCVDYLQLMSDSSCQPCPMGQTGQNSVCVDVRPQFSVFTNDSS